MFLSKYGAARHIYLPIVKRGAIDFAVGADWTPATGDVKISKDGGAAANVTNLPAAITMGNTAVWDFSLTATEMQAAQIVVTVADAATKAVEDQTLIIETYGNASGQHPFDLATATQNVNVASLSNDAITAAAIATDAFGALELASGAATEIANAVWATTMSELSAVPGVTDSVLAALEWLFTLSRNKRIQSTTTETVYKDNGATVIATAAKTDDGATFTRAEYS